ncbi:hypothetical protein PLICRDRAFT_52075 [Plicaturopsis crispa FD-325 SS-3]|nr:hypothetical protein PLICRDRAFT_52075 [Plicaturopsis crispa FD-325 SS-3]
MRAIKDLAHKFVILKGVWLRGGQGTFMIELEEEYYTVLTRFSDDNSRIQGQLRELREIFPQQFHDAGLFGQRWVFKLFSDAMGEQRSNISYRLRGEVGRVIFDADIATMNSPNERHRLFREKIGWKANADGTGEYDAVEAPILHSDDYDGTFSWDTAFQNRGLMLVFQAIIRGPGAAITLKTENKIFSVKAEILATKLDIRHTTPGAIAAACVLARWTLSADTELRMRGVSTGINYMDDFDHYLEMLTHGIHKNVKPVLQIFRTWDDVLFPGATTGIGVQAAPSIQASLMSKNRAMDLLNEAADAEGDGGAGGRSGEE